MISQLATPRLWNPLLELHRASACHALDREDAIARYSFAIPTEEALDVIASCSPAGVVEIGAGTGYWAKLLHDYGVDVIAYDFDPPPSPTNQWFAGSDPWHHITAGDEKSVPAHRDRTLLLVWPTRNQAWPADAIELFHRAGGNQLVYVGEGPGGRSGDDRLHALLGAIDHCYACEYDLADAACTCGTSVLWARTHSIEIPQWYGFDDRLNVYRAAPAPVERRPRRPRHRWFNLRR